MKSRNRKAKPVGLVLNPPKVSSRVARNKRKLRCNRARVPLLANARKLMRRDPTRTHSLRRPFAQHIKTQFALLKGKILKFLVTEDMFGLMPRSHTLPLANAFCPTGEGGGVDDSCSPHGGVRVIEDTDNEYKAEFDTPVGAYYVRAHCLPPCMRGRKEFRVDFALKSASGSEHTEMTGTAGASAVGVIRRVGQVVSHFVDYFTPYAVSFTADNDEPSRVRLYDRLSSALAKSKGYSLESSHEGQVSKYVLTANETLLNSERLSFEKCFDRCGEIVLLPLTFNYDPEGSYWSDASGIQYNAALPTVTANLGPAPGAPRIVAVDFDGRIVELRDDASLEGAVPRSGAQAALQQFRDWGLRVVVWTANENWREVGAYMDAWRLPYDEVNQSPETETGARKVNADVYLDDKGEGDPDTPWPELVELVRRRFDIGNTTVGGVLNQERLRQPAGSESALYALVGEALPQFHFLLRKSGLPLHNMAKLPVGGVESLLRKDAKCRVLIGPVKTAARAREKVKKDYGGDWSKLFDVLRASVACDSMAELRHAIGQVGDNNAGTVVRKKDRFRDPLPSGYRDVLVNYRLPCGMLVEVQYHLKPLLIARDKQAPLHSLLRTIRATMHKEGRRRMTEAEKAVVRQAKAAGQALLAKAWEECQADDPTLNALLMSLAEAPTANRRDFEFHTDPGKVEEFKRWLQTQYDALLTGTSEQELWQRYIQQGFQRGAGRAFDDTRQSDRLRPELQDRPDFYAGTREEFLRSSFGRPETVEKVQLLVSRTFDELKNVEHDLTTKLGRTLADGLVQGKGPREVARDLAAQTDLSRERALLISRTELIRAHAEGQLAAFEGLGIEELGVQAEFSSTKDDRVCAECEELEGSLYTTEEASGIIPVHPNCRCAWIPHVPRPKRKGVSK